MYERRQSRHRTHKKTQNLSDAQTYNDLSDANSQTKEEEEKLTDLRHRKISNFGPTLEHLLVK